MLCINYCVRVLRSWNAKKWAAPKPEPTAEQLLTAEFFTICATKVNMADVETKGGHFRSSTDPHIYLENLELEDIPEELDLQGYIDKRVYVVGPGSNTYTNPTLTLAQTPNKHLPSLPSFFVP
ncbi:hypothetical protein NEDG_02215, partial [Nematocida displodere]